MTHIARAKVPVGIQWEALLQHLYRSNLTQSEILEDQFAWLLQITSWKYNINWMPREGIVEVSLPMEESFPNVDLSRDVPDYGTGTFRDQMYDTLTKIVELVPPQRVLHHFVRKG